MGKPGNSIIYQPELFAHGIQTEDCDIRVHVCPGIKSVYAYKPKLLLPLIDKYKTAEASQPGINYKTARGHLVPILDIPDIRELETTVPWWKWFNHDDKTSEKGKKAVKVVRKFIEAGKFPLWINPSKETERAKLQISGTDLLLYGRWKIQVEVRLGNVQGRYTDRESIHPDG